MKLRKLAPLSLAVAIVVALSACGASDDAAKVAPAAPQAVPTKVDVSKLDAPIVAFSSSDLDPSIAACQDLNGFVNAKWLKANPVPSDRTSWGSFEVLAERSLTIQHALVEQLARGSLSAGSVDAKLADLWRTGSDEAAIDKAGITPLQPQLKDIDALTDAPAIAAWLRNSYAQGQGLVFSFGANADYKNSEQMIAYAGQGGLGLPEKGYYTDPAQAKIREQYVAYIARMLELSGILVPQAAAQAKAVMAFETRLANASLSRIELRDPAKRYNPVDVAGANAITPHFDWKAFFAALEVPAGTFSLSQPGYFAELDAMLADTPVDTWKAYLRFHTVDEAAPYLAKPFEQANFDFYAKTLRGQQDMLPRWKRTLNAVNEAMGEALGQLYVQSAFPAESKEQMQQLVQNLSAALKARLQKLDWMSAETKQRALEKWASFTPKIGYPDQWRDWSGLQTRGDGFLANMQAAQAFNYRYMLDKIGKPVDKREWHMTPQTVNAYYNATRNEIVFPAAILQPPFFDPKADPALNYGGIGARQRQADAGREYRRSGRPDRGVRCPANGIAGAAGRQQADRWRFAGPAVLHELGHGLAPQLHRRRIARAPEHRPARTGEFPRQRCAVEHAGVCAGFPVQARRCDGTWRQGAGDHLVSAVGARWCFASSRATPPMTA